MNPGLNPGPELDATLETHRVELTGYCYRMLGSAFEAEDAVQDTLVRAWKAAEKFEGRSSLRSWLYKIATNVCFDMLDGRQRRALPMDMGPARPAADGLSAPLPEVAWLQPVPDVRVVPSEADPADIAELRDSVRLAFVTTLQLLPPNQRAVLILREVLAWPAADVAELLGTSVPSVNSALQRARATLAQHGDPQAEQRPLDDDQRELLARYVEAFESYDMDKLTALLAKDASWSMPPFELWLQTHDDIRAWCLGPGIGVRRLQAGAGRCQRLPGLRAVQAGPRRWLRAHGRCRCSTSTPTGSSCAASSSSSTWRPTTRCSACPCTSTAEPYRTSTAEPSAARRRNRRVPKVACPATVAGRTLPDR